ncbi:N-acetylglucosaminyldiphosphoundecaprenol N-acetyl-beta-D-mannosaminyltransferase [Alkalithermobacter thermoalcaliphilus JW-YL-7 = DSM 7308]|uniref:N-acetylglucosaminyldiphosphoundecaprenol N-acetyl-beta-D-mannosaminyltransferase n=1 Tax=Alkalithermobacter thermoalcaliphilus JW-YL-7 = DSM 7308 TaxID=1121328 RepID=A0A150FTZ2_CLOPD|nr:glycosyl transferase, WecB/TagA/CpsF family [[Clostridium] paradoxum JW-YL-7 = DSM 7308]SHK72446.1 N-acetylglucosaminyldiphosphoundecaprenol N-acetyl-beta-D-mannosaminyltransferase [[Clostridium] paradoxum JW-YL-7 = DSM 7308]
MEKIRILGIEIDKVSEKDALDRAVKFLEKGKKCVIYTPNSEIIMQCQSNKNLANALKQADLVIPDGIGLVLASRVIKKPLLERVTGIDLMESILNYANENNKSIFILGAQDGISQKCAQNILKKYPNIKVKGVHHGYFKGYHMGIENHPQEKKVIQLINSLKPDILFVAFGAPKQEIWIQRYKNEIDAKIFMGVGGSVDVYAGKVKRAPKIYQNLGLEWLYRLIKEPWRYKRMMALPKFVIEVIKRGEN